VARPFVGETGDPGSSFLALLHSRGFDPFPAVDVGDAAAIAPHATTVLALRYNEGVVMAGDRRATMGNRISNREMEKVVPADRFSGVAISGTAGVAMDMIKIFQLQIEHYEKLNGRSISLEGKANQLSQMIKSNLPAAMQGLAVLPIFAGYDEIRSSGRLWDFDITGGRYEEKDFVATGSGAGPASTVLKVGFRPSLTADLAIDLACHALWEAADVDSATGGPDPLRGIYPIIACISREGWQQVDDADLARRFEAISSLRRDSQER